MELDLRRLADGLLKRRESDRAWVVGVLADEVVSGLTLARYLIEDAAQRLARGEREETSEELRNASARIRDVVQQVANLCRELRPRTLDDLGVLPALASYLRDFGRDNRGIFISQRISVMESEIPADLKLLVFRIMQTALSNVARHSKASAARVGLSLFEDQLRLVIEDDGVGFDVDCWRSRHQSADRCGLGMIDRWVEASGGRFTLEAVPRRGARVQALWKVSSAAVARSVESEGPGARSGEAANA